MGRGKTKQYWPAFYCVLFLLFHYAMTTSVLSQFKNTLHNNGSWESAKTKLFRGVQGASAFMVTRVPLEENRLNLGAWSGYQEILYKRKLDLQNIRFRIFLRPGDFSFIFNSHAKGFDGFRLSIQKRYPLLFFQADNSGKFLTQEAAPFPSLVGDRWYEVFVDFQEAGKITLSINGQKLISVERSYSGPIQIGFKGGNNEVWLDDIRIKEKNSPKIIEENFDHPRNLDKILLQAFLWVLLFNMVLAFSLKRNRVYWNLAMNLTAGLFLFLLFWTDRCFIVGKYPLEVRQYLGYKNTIEMSEETIDRIKGDLDQAKHSQKFRILLLGSSQTWGAGALNAESTIESFLARKLESRGHCYKVVNGGINGITAAQTQKLVEPLFKNFKPDMVLINLSWNDNRNFGFAKEFEGLVDSLISLGPKIKIVLLSEAHHEWFSGPGEQDPNHLFIEKFSRKRGISFVDMHKYLTERKETGFLWWDTIHLTSYGQWLFSERMFAEISPSLPPCQRGKGRDFLTKNGIGKV